MLHIHPNARTTPAVRAEITRFTEPSGTIAKRYGISAETVRKWRKRGASDCLDRSARLHNLPWKATEEECAIVRTLRRSSFTTRHHIGAAPNLDEMPVYLRPGDMLVVWKLVTASYGLQNAAMTGHELAFIGHEVPNLRLLGFHAVQHAIKRAERGLVQAVILDQGADGFEVDAG